MGVFGDFGGTKNVTKTVNGSFLEILGGLKVGGSGSTGLFGSGGTKKTRPIEAMGFPGSWRRRKKWLCASYVALLGDSNWKVVN